MKHILTLLTVLALFSGNSQVLIGGGASTQNGLNTGYWGHGINAFAEIPTNTTQTILIRFKYLNFNDKVDTTGYVNEFETPGEVLETTKYVSKNSLFDLTIGRRAYFINDYDIGFSAYGGIYLGLSVAPTKQSIRGFDELYAEAPAPGFARTQFANVPYTYFYVKTEFNGGLCYNLPLGNAVYFDAGFDYILLSNFGISTNQSSNRIGGFNFSLNLGYRHTIF